MPRLPWRCPGRTVGIRLFSTGRARKHAMFFHFPLVTVLTPLSSTLWARSCRYRAGHHRPAISPDPRRTGRLEPNTVTTSATWSASIDRKQVKIPHERRIIATTRLALGNSFFLSALSLSLDEKLFGGSNCNRTKRHGVETRLGGTSRCFFGWWCV